MRPEEQRGKMTLRDREGITEMRKRGQRGGGGAFYHQNQDPGEVIET